MSCGELTFLSKKINKTTLSSGFREISAHKVISVLPEFIIGNNHAKNNNSNKRTCSCHNTVKAVKTCEARGTVIRKVQSASCLLRSLY